MDLSDGGASLSKPRSKLVHIHEKVPSRAELGRQVKMASCRGNGVILDILQHRFELKWAHFRNLRRTRAY